MASFKSNTRKPYSRPSDGQWLHDKFQSGQGRRDQGLNGGAAAAPSNASAAPAPAGISNKLRVSNLHYEVTPQDLNAIFGQIGTLVREPILWYDQSGRSRGSGVVTFETAAEATRAKNQFDGILAKGQPMSVTYVVPPRPPRRTTSAPSGLSLLNRIEKPPLLNRLAVDDTATALSDKKSNGRDKGRIGPIRGKTTRATKAKQPKKPKTAEELDKELDAFMGDVEPASQAQAPAPVQDVDMA